MSNDDPRTLGLVAEAHDLAPPGIYLAYYRTMKNKSSWTILRKSSRGRWLQVPTDYAVRSEGILGGWVYRLPVVP